MAAKYGKESSKEVSSSMLSTKGKIPDDGSAKDIEDKFKKTNSNVNGLKESNVDEKNNPKCAGAANLSLSTPRVPQTSRSVGAIEALSRDQTVKNLESITSERQRKDGINEKNSQSVNRSPSNTYLVLDSKSVVAASKFPTPINPNQLPITSEISCVSSVSGNNENISANQVSDLTSKNVNSTVSKASSITNGDSTSALQPVNGQTYYSGHVKYEPPPIYSKGILCNSPLCNVSATCHNFPNHKLSSANNQSHNADVIIKPHSLANLKLHTYENVVLCHSHNGGHCNDAAMIIENKYASTRSSISSFDSKFSSPRSSLVNSFNHSGLERKDSNKQVSDQLSLECCNPHVGPVYRSHSHSLNSSPLNLGHQLPPRIEQDLEGRQFVIPRNNAYVEENARQSGHWSYPIGAAGYYGSQFHQSLCQTPTCCLSQSCRTPVSTPIATPSPTSFNPPPPYPGKPSSISSLSSSIDLNDSVLSLGSLRSASGVLASVNANHNYANIDVLKGNYNADQQLKQQYQYQCHLLANDKSSLQSLPPPPPYPSSAVRQNRPSIAIKQPLHPPQSTVCGASCRLSCSYRNNPATSTAVSGVSAFRSATPTTLTARKGVPPPPPPYPSTVVRSQLLGSNGLSGPSWPPYPSSAVKGLAVPYKTGAHLQPANQLGKQPEPPSIPYSSRVAQQLISQKANMNSSSAKSDQTAKVSSENVTEQLSQMNLTSSGSSQAATASDRLSKWQSKLNPTFKEGDGSSASAGGSSSVAGGGSASSAGDVSDTGSEKSGVGSDKSRTKKSGKSLLPYNVTAKTM
ncbi:hypothetical protein FHG87_013108, partial [Trinorchestia longiramus]